MIAKLTGTLDDFGPDWAVIDVAGVGYLIHCSARTLDALGVRGDSVTAYTQLQVSENDMRLIGFSSAAEREWFRLLTGVQGVGSKMALPWRRRSKNIVIRRTGAPPPEKKNCNRWRPHRCR